VVGLAGFRGSKMTQPPLPIFPVMDPQPTYPPPPPTAFRADGPPALDFESRMRRLRDDDDDDGVVVAHSLAGMLTRILDGLV
jgi:hypothetical protein